MKKATSKASGDMRAEYDFTGGERGKYYKAMQQGYTVTIHKSDGTTVVEHIRPDKRAVILEPDVRAYFPDSEAVNTALRTLISLIPGKRKTISKKVRNTKTG
jgi:hypothetical protein